MPSDSSDNDSICAASVFSATSSSSSMLPRSFFEKPNKNIHRVFLLLATKIRNPPLFPCPDRLIHFFEQAATKIAIIQSGSHFTHSIAQGKRGHPRFACPTTKPSSRIDRHANSPVPHLYSTKCYSRQVSHRQTGRFLLGLNTTVRISGVRGGDNGGRNHSFLPKTLSTAPSSLIVARSRSWRFLRYQSFLTPFLTSTIPAIGMWKFGRICPILLQHLRMNDSQLHQKNFLTC